MTSPIRIFVTGATGYIGGAVLTRLLEHPNASAFDISACTSSEAKSKLLEKKGVKTTIGAHDDLEKLTKLASEADYVIAMAAGGNVVSTKAILNGMKQHYEATKQVPVLIRTSGTSVFKDNAAGMYASDTIWDDTNIDQIETIPPTQRHRDVDVTVVQADKEGYVRSYIVLPSSVYGLATGTLADQGIANRQSKTIPLLINACIDRGQAGVIGKGKNIYNNVHINDIADLYIAVFDAIHNGEQIGHGREGFYVGENGDSSLYNINQAIAVALAKRGIGAETPTPFTKEELQRYFGGDGLGSNTRGKGTRSRAIGWKPTQTTADMLASIDVETEALLATRPSHPKL